MAIGDIFKKDNKEKAKAEGAASKPGKKTPETAASAKAGTKPAGKPSLAARVLKHAQVTEKASKLAESNQYVFQVAPGADKVQIALAVENYYKVSVVGVNVVNIPPKRRRMKKGIAVKPGYRKAIVSVKKGQSIEILPK